MRTLTELENQNEEFLTKKGIPFTTVLITDNILKHSIFDATRPMIKFFKEQGIHDYHVQEKGKDAKKYVTTHILTFKKEIMSRSSLYKAGTRGDMRMWFGAEILPLTEGGNIYTIMVQGNEFFILNESKIDIELCYTTSIDNPIKRFLRSF